MDILYCFESFMNEPLMIPNDIVIKIDKNTINTDKFRLKINNKIVNKNRNIVDGSIHKSFLAQELLMKQIDKLVQMKEYNKNHWKCRYIIRQFIDKKTSYNEAKYRLKYNYNKYTLNKKK